MRNLNMQEYVDYVKKMQGSIFQILPLYETDNSYLDEYTKDLYNEIVNVLDTIETLPHGAWYPTTRSTLKTLVDEVLLKDNKKSVKKKTFYIT